METKAIHLLRAGSRAALVSLALLAIPAMSMAGQDDGAVAPSGLAALVGTWRGGLPGGAGRDLPAIEVVVTQGAAGMAEVDLTIFRHEFTPDGSVKKTVRERPAVVDTKFSSAGLTFRTRDENFRPGPESAPQKLEVDWKLATQGEDATLDMVWNSLVDPARQRGVDVPPPPPALLLKRVR
jgi:hypothetical protein